MIISNKKGFTLIELIVSLGVFSVVILIALGAVLHIQRASDYSQAILTAISNLDFAMENMSRTIRTGRSYACGRIIELDQTADCQSSSSISVTDQKGTSRVIYYLENGHLMREKGSKDFSITAPEIEINQLNFIVRGSSDSPNDLQPSVMIMVSGKTRINGLKERDQAEFKLQTLVSQRNPDLD